MVDTGVGGPQAWLTDWRCVNRTVAEALADHGLAPADVGMVINSHLHFDHCGQNSVFRHAPFYVQRSELERAREQSKSLLDWFDFAGARFELLEGDTEIVEGVRAVATPGHTVGHQSLLVDGEEGAQLLIGDAAYTSGAYLDPEGTDLRQGQASDLPAWKASVRRLQGLAPAAVHFCHDRLVVR